VRQEGIRDVEGTEDTTKLLILWGGTRLNRVLLESGMLGESIRRRGAEPVAPPVLGKRFA